MRTRLGIMGWAGVLLLASGTAWAQDERAPGILIGEDFVAHAGLDFETQYDSNVFYEDRAEHDSPVLRVRPKLELMNHAAGRAGSAPDASSSRLSFRGALGLDYREYLSDEDVVTSQRGLGADELLEIGVNRGRPVSVTLFQSFQRSTATRNIPVEGNFDRDVFKVGPRLRFAPGGGRLESQLGYTFGLDRFEATQFELGNQTSHEIELTTQWRFLPKTALRLTASQGFIDYEDDVDPALGVAKVDSTPLRITAGLVGLVTQKLSVTVAAGYGNGFYDSGESPSSLLAEVSGTYRLLPTAGLSAGYRHLFEDSLVGNFVTVDELYGSYSHQIAGRLAFGLGGKLRRYAFDGFVPGNGELVDGDTRIDNVIEATASVDYYFRSYLSAGVGYQGSFNDSNFTSVIGAGDLNEADYAKHVVWLKVSAYY